ncbi:hypothetical protein [Halalkalibacter sp. APA_J-10(15)]|uniref:hypothetical protein n=1 Tax=unclassified Halalkalibacter TaxID=2893063 RepID=UPI001FF205DB|nr:hypothetical protein [Halalkalibacter sp. APA_J-10(15)]MCK0472470.1 hypothetical protein [Halalkalibacter sp. APA_J-10(15)]
MSQNLGLENLLKDLLDKKKDDKCPDDKRRDDKCGVEQVLKNLPPNYPIGGVFVKGKLIPVAVFSNICDCLAYFLDEECQVVVLEVDKITGISFGETPDPH